MIVLIFSLGETLNPVYEDGQFQTFPPPLTDGHGHPGSDHPVYSDADVPGLVFTASTSSRPNNHQENIESMYAVVRPRSERLKSSDDEPPPPTYMQLEDGSYAAARTNTSTQVLTTTVTMVPTTKGGMRRGNSAVYTDLHFGEEGESGSIRSVASNGSCIISNDGSSSETSADPRDTDSSGSSNRGSDGVSINSSSTDSGVDDERRHQPRDYKISSSSSSDDFEEENADYFEAKTLPFVQGHSDSLDSRGCGGMSHGKDADFVTSFPDKSAMMKGSSLNDSRDEDDRLTCYQKLRSNRSPDRSFSFDSACSDNTYNSLISGTGSLKIAEEDGKYSSLNRKDCILEGSRRDTDCSDNDNSTYSELIA